MFHLAFSTGEEHVSAAFHSIARAQSRGFEPRWPSIDEVEPSASGKGGGVNVNQTSNVATITPG
jgi:hypothetical protein